MEPYLCKGLITHTSMMTLFKSEILRRRFFAFASMVVLFAAGCNTTTNPPEDFVLTQEKLDAMASSAIVLDTGIVGDKFVVFHNRTDTSIVKNDLNTWLHSLRNVLANVASKDGDLPVGTVFLRLYNIIPDSVHTTPRTFTSVMVMVKQPRGFFPDGGDWEYIKIPVSNSTPSQHPYGLLSDSSVTRGKLATCGGCHLETTTKGMKNFLF